MEDRQEPESLPLSALERVDQQCSAFEAAWQNREVPQIEAFLNDTAGEERRQLLADLLCLDIAYLRRAGMNPTLAGYLARFPSEADLVKTAFDLEGPATEPVSEPGQKSAGDDTVPLNRQSQPQVGDTVAYFGDYELIEEIERGGMGVVYKARQTSLKRTVALKMILAGKLAGVEDVKRFHSEAEAAANLDHAGIVPIYEVGEQNGQHYFSMAYLEGKSLAELIKDGPLPTKLAAEYVKAIAEAVAFAHGQGVVHRDLKPGNVLLDRNGDPVVTDFGLAKRVEGDSDLTATGQVLGTPSYMPPEQALGNLDEVGPLADVYSLGAVLYALLTGRPPFLAENPIETLKQVVESEPIPPKKLNRSVPRDLDTICLKCLRKEPRKRYQAASELAEDLDRWLGNKPIVARRVGVMEKALLFCKRHPVRGGMLSVAITITLAGVAAYSIFAIQDYRRRLQSMAEAGERVREKSDLLRRLSSFDGLEKATDPPITSIRSIAIWNLRVDSSVKLAALTIEFLHRHRKFRHRIIDDELRKLLESLKGSFDDQRINDMVAGLLAPTDANGFVDDSYKETMDLFAKSLILALKAGNSEVQKQAIKRLHIVRRQKALIINEEVRLLLRELKDSSNDQSLNEMVDELLSPAKR